MEADLLKPKIPAAPKHLRPETRTWWRAVLAEFELKEHHQRVLTLAAEAWDRCSEARERIARDGAYSPDRWGQLKPHPALLIERDSRLAFARLLRQLGLGDTSPIKPELYDDDRNPFK